MMTNSWIFNNLKSFYMYVFWSQGDQGLPGEVGAPGVSGVGEPGPKVCLKHLCGT